MSKTIAVHNTCKSAFSQLYNIRRIRKYLTTDVTSKTLVHAMITSRVDYWNSLLCGLPDNSLNKLQRVQNAAARLITGTAKFSHITPVLRTVHSLPIKQRVQFKMLILVFKAINGLAPDYKQLLDKVFVISRIIEVSVRVISRSRRLRLITLTETLIILDITKTESNNCFIIHWTKKKLSYVFSSSLTASNTKRANLTWLPLEIMHRGHTWHDYPWPWVSLTWLLYNLQFMTSRALISKIPCTLLANQKRVTEFNV